MVHVTDYDFCQNNNQNELLVQIIQTAKKEKYLSAKQLLVEAYEQSSGIFDYFTQSRIDKSALSPDEKRPLLSMSMSPSEDTYRYSKIYDTIKSFADNNVKDFYGINLQEFLQYPRVICEFILKDSAKRLASKISYEKEALDDIQGIANKK